MVKDYRIADTNVRIHCQHDYFDEIAGKYEVNIAGAPQEEITVTREEIPSVVETSKSNSEAREGIWEALAIYRKLCDRLVFRDVILLHSSAIALGGKAYLFTAPSGTGKSTHARLWREAFGDEVVMINDDKPLIRIENGRAVAYGTPWNGKHNLGNNIEAPIGGICLLRRGARNKIWPMEEGEILSVLMSQTYRPGNEKGVKKMVELIFRLAKAVPFWKMECNMDPEAAAVARKAMEQ